MTNMTQFFTTFLAAISQWLGSDPIIYLFGLTCLLGVCRAIKMFLPS